LYWDFDTAAADTTGGLRPAAFSVLRRFQVFHFVIGLRNLLFFSHFLPSFLLSRAAPLSSSAHSLHFYHHGACHTTKKPLLASSISDIPLSDTHLWPLPFSICRACPIADTLHWSYCDAIQMQETEPLDSFLDDSVCATSRTSARPCKTAIYRHLESNRTRRYRYRYGRAQWRVSSTCIRRVVFMTHVLPFLAFARGARVHLPNGQCGRGGLL
jgi:hypothetical protein